MRVTPTTVAAWLRLESGSPFAEWQMEDVLARLEDTGYVFPFGFDQVSLLAEPVVILADLERRSRSVLLQLASQMPEQVWLIKDASAVGLGSLFFLQTFSDLHQAATAIPGQFSDQCDGSLILRNEPTLAFTLLISPLRAYRPIVTDALG